MTQDKTIGIGVKFVLFVLLIMGFATGLSLFVGYIWGRDLIQSAAGKSQHEIAGTFASAVSRMLNKELEEIDIYTSLPEIRKAMEAKNLEYADVGEDAIMKEMLETDKEWISAQGNDSPVIQKYLSSEASKQLANVVEKDSRLGEMFITDKYGGLVAASGRTSDYYQADESWWNEAYNHGKGKVFFEGLSYDDSSKTWGVTVAMPVYAQNGEVSGVCKAVVNISEFVGLLNSYKFGKTGRAFFVSQNGNALQYLNTDLSRVEGFTDTLGIVNNDVEWSVSAAIKPFPGEALVSWERIEYPLLRKYGVTWYVFVAQTTQEAFASVHTHMKRAISGSFLVLIISALVAAFLAQVFVSPITQLNKAILRIIGGDLKQRVPERTGGEIGELTGSFNKMVVHLQDVMVSRDAMKKEVDDRTDAQAKLSAALEEATKARGILTSMLQDNNDIRGQMEKNLKDLKHAQSLLIHAEKMEAIGRMAGGIAHEVKNPLGIILQGINYFEAEVPLDASNQREMLSMMKDGVKRADRIIRALLDFSRAEELKLVPMEINPIIEEALHMVMHRIRLNDIVVVQELSGGLPKVMADGGKIEQVLVNLFNNAMDAMANGGTLRVRSSLSTENDGPSNDKAVVVEVSDTGKGMDEDTMKKIFDPFFTTKNRTEGTGLGLSVSKSIIEMHKGTISVSTELGKGTMFIMRFKLNGGV